MPSDLSQPESPWEVGQQVMACVDRFLQQHPAGNNKNWCDLKGRLLRWVQGIEPKLAFEGLFSILESQTRYQYQLMAGELMQRAALPSSLPLPELLRRLLPAFEESAHTVPAYIRSTAGRETVLLALRELEEATTDPALIQKIRTMRWWMDAPEEPGHGR